MSPLLRMRSIWTDDRIGKIVRSGLKVTVALVRDVVKTRSSVGNSTTAVTVGAGQSIIR